MVNDLAEYISQPKTRFVDCLIAAAGVAKNVPVSSFDRELRGFVVVRAEIE